MALPDINIYSIDSQNIGLTWFVDLTGNIVSYKLYGSTTYNGVYSALTGYNPIPNNVDARTPGNVFVLVKRSDIGIDATDPYFFKMTSIDPTGAESSLSSSNFTSVDALGDFYRNRLSDNKNVVYKNIPVSVGASAVNVAVPVSRILGREADSLIITTDQTVTVKFNDENNDAITVTSTTPFESLFRGMIVVDNIYLSGGGTLANVKIFCSGN